MYVSSILSYSVRTFILLHLINSTAAYKKQNLTVKNDYLSGISEKARKDFRSPRPSLADSSLLDLRESNTKVGFITGEAKKNDTSETGAVKRTKRCLLTMLALGAASMATDWLFPPKPQWTPPPTTTRPVWNPPPPVWQPPPPVWQPPPTTTRPVWNPPPPVWKPPPPVWQPPPPVWQPPPTTTRPVWKPPPPVWQPPPTTTRPVWKPPPPVWQPPPPVWQPPPTTTRPVWQPPPTTTRPVWQPPPTTTRPVWQPPPPVWKPPPPVWQPPPPVWQPPPTTTTTTTRPPTTTTTTRPPTTTTTEVPTITTMKPTIGSTTLLPDLPTTIRTTYNSTGVDTSIERKDDDHYPHGKVQEPASEYDRINLNVVRDKWINATGGATEMGLVVMDGVPESNISTAMVVTKTEKKIAFNDIEVLEFVHPLTNEKIIVPSHGGDEYVDPETRKVFVIFVDNDGRTFLIFKDIDHSIAEKHPDQNNSEVIWSNIVNETTDIARVTKWGSIVVRGVPKYNLSEATIVNKSEKKTDSNGTQVLEFVHPFTNEIVEVPLNGGDEFVKHKTGEVFIIFVDNQNRTILIFKDIVHSIAEKYTDENNDENTWNIIVKETTNITRVTKWGSIVVGGVPKYKISEATIVNETEKKTNSEGTDVLEFVHPFTNEIVQVPLNGGDEFVKHKTGEVYIIFVDNQNRTILIFKGFDHSIIGKYPDQNNSEVIWNNIENEITNIVRVTKWGSIVVRGVPKYNLSEATIVNETEKKINSEGTDILEFPHPFTNETVQVPLNGGDEFVKHKTGEVYIIFVDNKNRTLLIFKGFDHSIIGKHPDQNNSEVIWNNIVNETTNIARVTKWGSIVVRGVPKYNISEATIVNETVKKTNSEGTDVLEFVHPFTNKTVQVPLNGGDKFVILKTGEVYIIFVDIYGRTLLIFKGIDDSVIKKYPDGNNGEDTWKIIVKETTKIVRVTKWGSIVIEGIPKYNLSEATVVNETEKKTNSNGADVLEFLHPFTNEIVQVPLNGGDEFVKHKTQEVYSIFVDNQNRTVLIFKGIDHSPSSPGRMTNNTNSDENIDENSMADVKIVKDEWGSLVVSGVPKYDIESATIVTETKQMIVNGTSVLEFTHPMTQNKIRVPLKGGDEYINQTTKESYIIFVDDQGRTLLILNHEQPSKNIVDSKDDSDAVKKIISVSKWGSLVVKGVPQYNISSALIITKTKKMIGFDGITVLEFVHPITQEKVQVPFEGGDEYVIQKTQHIFIIFVDVYKRTLLILKNVSNRPISSNSGSEEGTIKIEAKFDQCWGTIVIGGYPEYDIANAVIVKETRQKIENGVSVIEFTHPITLQVIDVPYEGGDEYVDPMTKQIFIIFVDILERTILILRPSDSSVDSDEDPNAKKEYSSRTDRGSVVVGGVPKYNIASAIIVKKTERIMKNGSLGVEFEHPITREVINVPYKGGDEYVDPMTKQVFMIFVDVVGRTILILKRSDSSVDSQETNESNFDSDEKFNDYANKNKYKKVPDTNEWGSVVVSGVPKYDIASATVVKKTEQVMKNGSLVVEFEHPITREVINVPYKGGDEYVDPMTKQVFIIFVDVVGRTILILKRSDSSLDSQETNESNFDSDEKFNDYANKNKYKKVPDTNEWGSVVVSGVPKYDIASAIVVKKTEQVMKNGSLVVEFEHPITREVINVPYKGGDEYVDPMTKQVFIIFVDVVGRTILILKRSDSSLDSQETNESNFDSDEKFNDYANKNKYKKVPDTSEWGSVVVRGVPKYYMSKAMIVMDVKKKMGVNGVPVLEFKHPVTEQTIQVPVDGGDEYVNPKTREIFVICVDLQRRTLLIFKGFDNSASVNEMSFNNAENYDENSAESDEDPDVYSNLNANVVTPDSMPFEDYDNDD